MPSIWSIKEEEEEEKVEQHPEAVVSSSEEADLERPSFLRRLTKKRSGDHKEDKGADSDAK
jgi:hypothetical protein